MKTIRLAVIHFMPLEFYPPVSNFLNFISKKEDLITIALSTWNNKKRKTFENKNIRIYRKEFPSANQTLIISFFKYWLFNLFTLFKLISKKPNAILYYETYSAWPVYMYRRIFNKQVKILIHYHEYTTPSSYKCSMALFRWYHLLERKFLYNVAFWISHTNDQRLHLFQNDHPTIEQYKLHTLPNYPPSTWIKTIRRPKLEPPYKFVYIGSLSIKDTYIKEFCEWIINKENMLFDIYSFNFHADTYKYIKDLNSTNINLMNEGIEYNSIPDVLKSYDIGLVLYKGNTLNYIYNAPNKLFEYMACNLDVWFPSEMKGCYPYTSVSSFPKICKVDFTNLDNINLLPMTDRTSLKYKPSAYYYEDVYDKLYDAII